MTKPDRVDAMGHSVVQHGRRNNRVYLMKLDQRDVPGIVGDLDTLAQRESYSKIFAKVPESHVPVFAAAGYRREALVPRYFGGLEDGAFLCKYFLDERKRDPSSETIAENLRLAEEKATTKPRQSPPDGFSIRLATEDDVVEMAAIYRKVFASYPFPIHKEDYLKETLRSHVRYYLAIQDGKILALSSAEMDTATSTVEMTDFATPTEHRGAGLASLLLAEMEADPMVSRLHTAYTIARALSPGINIIFARLGYRFAGTLINNTDISGSIESMNVWYKSLRRR